MVSSVILFKVLYSRLSNFISLSRCPHCHRYKPDYIRLAKDIQHRNTGQVPVAFYALSCVAHPTLCDAYEVESFPTILGFPLLPSNATSTDVTHDSPVVLNKNGLSDMTPDIIASNLGFSVTHSTGKNIILQSEEDRKELESRYESLELESIRTKINRIEYPKKLTDIYMDAALSLTFALEHGVYVKPGPLSEDRFQILKRFLDILLWTTPKEWGYVELLEDLRRDLPTIRMSKSHLRKVLYSRNTHDWSIVGNSKPNTQTWSEGCSHGNPGAGFTCGLWELFHIMTVGAAEQLEMAYTSGYHDLSILSNQAVALVIRDFIDAFFNCAVCREHFVNAYDSCDLQVCTRLSADLPFHEFEARELAIWIWEMHNAVNTRLAQEDALENEWRNATRRELDVSVFPSLNMCPTCRVTGPDMNLERILTPLDKNSLKKEEKASNVKWDSQELYTFLKNYYW